LLFKRVSRTLLNISTITLPLASIGGSHSTCFVCKKRGPKLIVASASVRFNCFLYNNIIVPAGSRCCPGHSWCRRDVRSTFQLLVTICIVHTSTFST
jgi:hypothetical protein